MTQDHLKRLWEDPKNWKLGVFYFCSQDPRIVVPKRIPWTGYTLNFSRKLALPVLITSMFVMAAPFLWLIPLERRQNPYWIIVMFAVVVGMVVVLCHWESTRER